MALSYVDANSAATTSVTLPAHAVGDIFLMCATRGNNTAPSIPAAGGTVPTWNSIQSGGANTWSMVTAWARATATNHTSGTWTNATNVVVLVLRGALGTGSPIGGNANGNGNNTTNVIYPAATLTDSDGSSWVVRFGSRATASTLLLANLPASYTARREQPTVTPVMIGLTRSGVTSNPTADTIVGGVTNAAYRCHTIEVLEEPPKQGSGNVDAVASLSGTGQASYSGSGNLDAVAGLAGAGLANREGSGSIDAVASLGGEGSVVASGAGELAGIGLLEGEAGPETASDGDISGVASLSGVGSIDAQGSGSVGAIGTLEGDGSAPASQDPEGSGFLDAVGSLVGDGSAAIIPVNIPRIRDAVKARLSTIAGLNVYDTVPGQIHVPAAIVRRPRGSAVTAFETRALDYEITVTVVSNQQDSVDGFVSPDSIAATIDEDPTLGGVVEYAAVTDVDEDISINYAGITYVAADVLLTVATN